MVSDLCSVSTHIYPSHCNYITVPCEVSTLHTEEPLIVSLLQDPGK